MIVLDTEITSKMWIKCAKCQFLVLLLLTTVLPISKANSAVIFSGMLNPDVAASTDGTSIGSLSFFSFGIPPSTVAFFEPLSTTLVGNTFEYSTGVNFDNAVAILTNGENGIVTGSADASGIGTFESILFSSVSLNGIDLAGFTISSIQWTINSYSFNNATNSVSLQSTLTINGPQASQLPLPMTFGLVVLGLIGLRFRQRAIDTGRPVDTESM